MTAPLSFVVYGAPVPKGRPRFGVGRTFTPARTRDYEAKVRAAAIEALAERGAWCRDHVHGYRVRVAVYRAAKRGDLDNYVKAATDALNGLVFDDDRRIVVLHALMFDDRADPRMLVEVEAVAP
jgi:Holliday junction resolvase RusA-like endonuclease